MPAWIVAGLSPLMEMTGGVSVASLDEPGGGVALLVPLAPVPELDWFAAATIAWNWAGVTHVEPTQSSFENFLSRRWGALWMIAQIQRSPAQVAEWLLRQLEWFQCKAERVVRVVADVDDLREDGLHVLGKEAELRPLAWLRDAGE